MTRIELSLNGKSVAVEAQREASLLEVLRESLGLSGAKYGCGEGVCGACTVLIAGRPRRACQVTLAQVGKQAVVSIEGLAPHGELHPVQKAFLEAEAFQCGFCTPAMVLASAALLTQNPKPSRSQIEEYLHGHLCRCGTYPRIVTAVQLAAQFAAQQGAE